MVTLIYSNSSLRDIENIKEFLSTDSVFQRQSLYKKYS